jgi:hypothetical protein
MLKDALVQEVDLFLLKPAMVAKYQSLLLHHLAKSLEGQKAGKDARMNLLKGLHAGDIQAWLGVAGPEDARRIVGLVFTAISVDPYLAIRRMLVYGLHMQEQLSPDAVAKCLGILGKYAEKRGCYAMVAQTSVRGVARLLENNGWTNGQSVLTKEI